MFTRPTRLRADVAIDTGMYIDTIVAMLACHHSQVFEWLPYHDGILDSVPDTEPERIEWLRDWYSKHAKARADHFRDDLISIFGEKAGNRTNFAEVYEISEYGAPADPERIRELFPSGGFPS